MANDEPRENDLAQATAEVSEDELWRIAKQEKSGFPVADWERFEVVVDQVWQLDRHCDYQGGARALPGGGRLATCSPQGQVFGFSAEQPSRHAWGASALCETDGGYITRALPAPW